LINPLISTGRALPVPFAPLTAAVEQVFASGANQQCGHRTGGGWLFHQAITVCTVRFSTVLHAPTASRIETPTRDRFLKLWRVNPVTAQQDLTDNHTRAAQVAIRTLCPIGFSSSLPERCSALLPDLDW
jgi:hypothetical protein